MPATAPRSRRPLIWLAATLAVPAAIYGATLYPGVGGRLNPGDSAKFQFIGEVLGVPHQPGYPQYVMLNHAWTRLPLPFELAVRVNLLSAVLALVAGGFLFTVLRRASGSDPAAMILTWAVLLSRPVWTFATEAEVHALHLAYVAAVAWAAKRWEAGRARGALVTMLAIGAFAFGNHPTAVNLLPALLAVVLAVDRRMLLDRRVLTATVAAVTLSVAQYGYVLWRSHSDAPFVESMPRDGTLGDLARSMTGSRFAEQFVLRSWEEAGARLAGLPAEAMQQLGPAVMILALLGLLAFARRRQPLGWFGVTLGAATCVFIAAYQIGDWSAYLAPLWVAAALLAAFGYSRLEGGPLRAAALATGLAWLVFNSATAWGELDLAESPADRGALMAVAPRGSIVMAYAGPSYPQRQFENYYREGLGVERRLGVRLVSAFDGFVEERLFLNDRPIVFTSRQVMTYFEHYNVGRVARHHPELGGLVSYQTGSEWPVERLVVTPLDGGLEAFAEGARLGDRETPIQIMIFAPRDRRLRAVVSFDSRGREIPPPGSREDPRPPDEDAVPVLDLVRLVRGGDWIVALFQPEAVAAKPALPNLVARQLGRRVPLDAAGGSVLLAGRRAGHAPTALVDPGERVTVEIAP